MNSDLLKLLFPVAVCHALSHVTSIVSFIAVAVSFTHSIKRNSFGTIFQCGCFSVHPWPASATDAMVIFSSCCDWGVCEGFFPRLARRGWVVSYIVCVVAFNSVAIAGQLLSYLGLAPQLGFYYRDM